MAVVKPKNMHPFAVLSIFGQSYNNYQYSEKLFRLLMEIELKLRAVFIAYNLLIKQIEVLEKELKNTTPRARSYSIEIELMAYLGFFIDTIYSLTERVAYVTKIFHDNKWTENSFHTQRNMLKKDLKFDPLLSKLMAKISWYDLFLELRTQHAHYGTTMVAYSYDSKSYKKYPKLVIELGGDTKKNLVLTGSRYNFDLRRTVEVADGLEKFIQDWSLILLKKLDMNTTMFGIKDGLTLKQFMEGRST